MLARYHCHIFLEKCQQCLTSARLHVWVVLPFVFAIKYVNSDLTRQWAPCTNVFFRNFFHLKIYPHKGKILKSVFYCNKLLIKPQSSVSVVFITPHLSVILWNSPFMHSVNKLNTAYFNRSCNVFTCLLNKQKNKLSEVENSPTGQPYLDLWAAFSIP